MCNVHLCAIKTRLQYQLRISLKAFQKLKYERNTHSHIGIQVGFVSFALEDFCSLFAFNPKIKDFCSLIASQLRTFAVYLLLIQKFVKK